MSIHLASNAVWAQTGYGVQAKLMLPRFQKMGYGVSMTAYYGLQGHTLKINDMLVFPVGHHPYGQDVCAANAIMAQADILMTLVDIWVCEPQNYGKVPWVPYFPIDSGSVSPLIRLKLPSMFQGITFSKSAQKLIELEGFETLYVPHCVDTQVFHPIDRAAAFEDMNAHIPQKIDKDKFLVSMVAMNKGQPSRKAFTQHIRAFKELHDRHPDSAMYIHCTKGANGENGGVDLTAYCKFVGLEIGKDIFFPDELTILNGYPDEFLNSVYNASDVLASVTMGEGFGVPILEAQACGCPVITGDWTAMPEITFSGWKVHQSEAQEWWTTLGAIQYSPNWQAIHNCMEQAYQKKGNQFMRDKAFKGAKQFDADIVVEKYWRPALETIQKKLQERPVFSEVPK